jgi:hypothetical protein
MYQKNKNPAVVILPLGPLDLPKVITLLGVHYTVKTEVVVSPPHCGVSLVFAKGVDQARTAVAASPPRCLISLVFEMVGVSPLHSRVSLVFRGSVGGLTTPLWVSLGFANRVDPARMAVVVSSPCCWISLVFGNGGGSLAALSWGFPRIPKQRVSSEDSGRAHTTSLLDFPGIWKRQWESRHSVMGFPSHCQAACVQRGWR